MPHPIITSLLFDAGHTLIYPRTGHWFIPPQYENFFKVVLPQENSEETIAACFNTAYQYLCTDHLVLTEQAEHAQFTEFYRIWLKGLTTAKKSTAFYAALAEDTVFNPDKYLLYPDTTEFLKIFATRYKLGIISDTWPSLTSAFRKLGIADYFSVFVISSVLGINKPAPEMYTHALNQLGSRPENAFFIDDCEANVEGAAKLGIQGAIINRNNSEINSLQYPVILDLKDLNQLLDMKNNQDAPGQRPGEMFKQSNDKQ